MGKMTKREDDSTSIDSLATSPRTSRICTNQAWCNSARRFEWQGAGNRQRRATRNGTGHRNTPKSRPHIVGECGARRSLPTQAAPAAHTLNAVISLSDSNSSEDAMDALLAFTGVVNVTGDDITAARLLSASLGMKGVPRCDRERNLNLTGSLFARQLVARPAAYITQLQTPCAAL